MVRNKGDETMNREFETIRDMAMNETARAMMAEGFILSADEAAGLGDDNWAWVRSRLGLTVDVSENGDVVGAPR